MRALAVDENGDIYIGDDGHLAIVEGIDAVLQVCQSTMQTLRGEMPFNADSGLPYAELLWSGAPDLVRFEAEAISALQAVDGVTSVNSITIELQGGDVSYTAMISTIYGPGTLNG